MNEPSSQPRYTYACFYEGTMWSTDAGSWYAAKQLAIAHFKPPKSKQHMISVVLAEKNGEPIVTP